MTELVTGIDVLKFGQDPDLQKINVHFSHIVLFMTKTTAGTHALYPVFMNNIAISHGVFMVHASLEHDGNDLHVHVRMDTKSFSWLHIIIIESKKSPKCGLDGIVVIAETKKEIAFEPANIFSATLRG